MAINKDIKDKVYIDGQWIDDFYLTQEKNEELKNLRSDLTKSTEELRSGISGNTSNISILDQAINFETDRAKEAEATLQTAIEEETSARTQADETLQTNITTETNTRIAEDQKLQENINTVQSKVNDLKTYSDNTFQTKVDASNEHTTLSEQITSEVEEAVNNLTNEINEKITGVNKWVGPVDTIADLPTNLDPDYTYLCKVIEEEATYQLIAGTSEWKLYSSIKDYVDSNELTTAINEHNISETAHNDIRQELETLNEVVDSLSGGTATDLTDIKNRLSTAENDIDTLQSEAHIHANKDLLDTYTQTEANLADAVAKKHEHTNKSILDNITASYTEEEKEKLSSLNSDNYEKISNKVTEINDDANDTTYPTSSAVKSYVEANQSNIDTSNLVHRTGDPQEVTASTTFTNLSLGDGSNNVISFNLENSNLNINNDLNTLSITTYQLNSTLLNIDNLFYNDVEYGIYGHNSNLPDQYLLVNKAYVDSKSGSSSIDTFQGDIQKVTYIFTENFSKDYLLLNYDDTLVVLNGSETITVDNGEGESQEVIISGPLLYTCNGTSWTFTKVMDMMFYSNTLVTNLQDTSYTSENGLYLYGLSVDNSAINLVQIYPTNIPNLTLTQDGTTLGTYTGESDISINIPKQDLSNYVTNTSLSSTLSNYVTTTNLNESLDDYLLKTGGTMTGNITLVASQSYITVGSYNILGDNGAYYFVGNEVKPLELRGNDLRPTYRASESDSAVDIALYSDLQEVINLNNSSFQTNYQFLPVGEEISGGIADAWVTNENASNKAIGICINGLNEIDPYITNILAQQRGIQQYVADTNNNLATIQAYITAGSWPVVKLGVNDNEVWLTKDGFTFNNKNILTEDSGIIKQQGTENAGKALVVGDDGNITFTNYAFVQEDGTIIFEASL